MYEMLERNRYHSVHNKESIFNESVNHRPSTLEKHVLLEWYFVVDFEVVFWFYLCLYFLFFITWIIWSRYSKISIHRAHLTSLLVYINPHISINLKVITSMFVLSNWCTFLVVDPQSHSDVGQKAEEELSDLDQLLQEHIQRARHNPGAV